MMKNMIIIAVILFFGSLSLEAKVWMTKIQNKSSQVVTVSSNDPSAKNNSIDKNGRWVANYKNPISIDPCDALYFNDYVVGWKNHDSKVTVTTRRGEYMLQEDNNFIFLSEPGVEGRREIPLYGKDSINLIANPDDSLAVAAA